MKKKLFIFTVILFVLTSCSVNEKADLSSSSYHSSSLTTEKTSVTQEQTKSMTAYLMYHYTNPEGKIIFVVFDPQTLNCKEIIMDGTKNEDTKGLYFSGNDYVTIEIQQEGDTLKCMNNAFKVIEPPDTTSATIEPDGTWNYEPLIGHLIANDTEIGKKLTDIYSLYDFIVGADEEYKYLPPDKINEELCMMYTMYSTESKVPYTEALWPGLKQSVDGKPVCHVFDADIFLDAVHHFFPATADVDFKNHFQDTEYSFYYTSDKNQFIFDIGELGGVRFPPFLIEFESLPDNTIRFVFMNTPFNYWEYTVKLLDNDGFQFIKIDYSTSQEKYKKQ